MELVAARVAGKLGERVVDDVDDGVADRALLDAFEHCVDIALPEQHLAHRTQSPHWHARRRRRPGQGGGWGGESRGESRAYRIQERSLMMRKQSMYRK